MTEQRLLPVTTRSLPGGSTLYHINVRKSPLVLVEAVVRTGSIHEEADAGCGLSHFLEHMLFQGCDGYPGNQASEKVHALGGECNAYTSFDHTAYYVELPEEKLEEALDILCRMVAKPLFPEAKFNSEKQVIAREADMIYDQPDQLAAQNLWQELYPGHPARFPIVGYPDKIAGVDRETMVKYYQRRYGSGRTYWLVAGGGDTDRIQTLLSEKLSGFARGNLEEPVLPPVVIPQFERRCVAQFPDPVARIVLGFHMPPSPSPVVPVLDVLSGILGENDSSRLVRKLWQEEELAISLGSSGYAAGFGGVCGISASCEADKLGALEAGIRRELELVRKNGVSASELEHEKLQHRMAIYRSLQTAKGMLNAANSCVLEDGSADVLEAHIARIENLTLEEVNAVAREFLNPDHLVWSILEPEKTGCSVPVPEKPEETIPEIRSGKTVSGVAWAMIRRDALPLDDLMVLLPAGPAWEAEEPHPVSMMLVEMLSSGPDTYSESEFYQLLDAHGIDLEVDCGRNTLSIAMNFLPEERPLAEEIMTGLLLHPRWDKLVFAREKRNLCEQWKSQLMNPLQAALALGVKELFPNHPAGRSRMGTPETLAAVKLFEIKRFYASQLDPEWVKFGSSWSGNAKEVGKIERFFETLSQQIPWSKKSLQVIAMPQLGNACRETAPLHVDLPREQASVVLAVPSCRATAPERVGVDILDRVLNGLSSNLFNEVREKRALAYTTGVCVNYGLYPGMIALYAGVKPERAEEALACLHTELERLASGGLTEQEFKAARLGAISMAARHLEAGSNRLLLVMLSLFYREKPVCGLTSAEQLKKLKYNDCRKMIGKLLSQLPRIAVIAGPFSGKVKREE